MAFEIFARRPLSRRGSKAGEDHGLGAGRDGLLDGVGCDAEVLRFAGFEKDDFAAGVLNDVLEADPVRDGQG